MFGLGPTGLPLGGMRDFGAGRRRGYRHPYAVILALQLIHWISNLRRKPPLTLALMAGMSVFHLKPDLLGDMLVGGRGVFQWSWLSGGIDHVRSVCLLPAAVLDSYER